MRCKHKRCYRKAAEGRRECSVCKTTAYRNRHRIKYCYQTLKDNAKRRKKEFDLTFRQFKHFAIKNKMVMGSGRSADSYTIDRIDNNRGYTVDNIQVLTRSENSSKGTRKLEYDYRTGYATYTKEQPSNNEVIAPF